MTQASFPRTGGASARVVETTPMSSVLKLVSAMLRPSGLSQGPSGLGKESVTPETQVTSAILEGCGWAITE